MIKHMTDKARSPGLNPIGRWVSGAALIGALLILQSCASPPEWRPSAISDAESELQQGTAAYHNDEYPLAAQHFSRALNTYQSLDHFSGMLNSRINLIETAIAIGNLAQAELLLASVEAMQRRNHTTDYQTRIALLKTRLFFHQRNYPRALFAIQPLIAALNEQTSGHSENERLNILSSMARLAITRQSADATQWLQRFQHSLRQSKQDNVRYQALLYRLQAQKKQQEGAYAESQRLLEQALASYQQLAYRRGIAASLQQLAELEAQQQHWQQADGLLQRALPIHLWTLNRIAATQVLERLIDINHRLDRKEIAESFNQQLSRMQSTKQAVHPERLQIIPMPR